MGKGQSKLHPTSRPSCKLQCRCSQVLSETIRFGMMCWATSGNAQWLQHQLQPQIPHLQPLHHARRMELPCQMCRQEPMQCGPSVLAKREAMWMTVSRDMVRASEMMMESLMMEHSTKTKTEEAPRGKRGRRYWWRNRH